MKRPYRPEVLVPPNYQKIKGPVVFLAGPIQGADYWQDAAILLLNGTKHKLSIANPRRSDTSWQFQFDIQVDWETYYLDRAHREGVILFWLAKETVHSCDRAYAQTTRFELGEWLAKYVAKKFHIVLGIEQGFTGERYIRRRLATDKRLKHIPVFNNLADVCNHTLGVIAKRSRKCQSSKRSTSRKKNKR